MTDTVVYDFDLTETIKHEITKEYSYNGTKQTFIGSIVKCADSDKNNIQSFTYRVDPVNVKTTGRANNISFYLSLTEYSPTLLDSLIDYFVNVLEAMPILCDEDSSNKGTFSYTKHVFQNLDNYNSNNVHDFMKKYKNDVFTHDMITELLIRMSDPGTTVSDDEVQLLIDEHNKKFSENYQFKNILEVVQYTFPLYVDCDYIDELIVYLHLKNLVEYNRNIISLWVKTYISARVNLKNIDDNILFKDYVITELPQYDFYVYFNHIPNYLYFDNFIETINNLPIKLASILLFIIQTYDIDSLEKDVFYDFLNDKLDYDNGLIITNNSFSFEDESFIEDLNNKIRNKAPKLYDNVIGYRLLVDYIFLNHNTTNLNDFYLLEKSINYISDTFEEFEDEDNVNLIMYKLLKKLSLSDIIEVLKENHASNSKMCFDDFNDYIDNFDNYSDMPVSWRIPLIKN